MKPLLKRLTVDVPEETYDAIKLLTVIYKKNMREIIIDAVSELGRKPSKRKELRDLKYALYRSEYDNHEEGRK